MAGRAKRPVLAEREELDAGAVVAKYRSWLRRQPLAGRSREAYLAQVSGFVSWLAGSEQAQFSRSCPQPQGRRVRGAARAAWE
ncbi:MAG: hypothetical protein M1435_01765 [Actinobacteria bacterium]|nr:hypothetical protein [Actinomycetota bacterium]